MGTVVVFALEAAVRPGWNKTGKVLDATAQGEQGFLQLSPYW